MSLIAYIPLLLKGTGVTLASWVIATLGALVIGILCGIFSCRALTTPGTFFIIKTYTTIAKGVPAYIQILIAYFVLPSLLALSVSGFVAATAALVFCSGGYVTEIICAGINSIPQEQWDACYVLGYSKMESLRRIIAPQMFALVTPVLLGESEQLLKSTSLLATIGVTELTRTGMNIISRELNPVPVYLGIAGIYLLFSLVLTGVAGLIQKRYLYDKN